uniref:Reverse transcriptase n=1 Tax=Panagrolaimus superbus TaxID=310955 RepID=A0A914YH60_9BILA
MPTQKLDAIRVFLIPRFSYLMQNSSPRVEDLAEFDRAIKFAVKKICRIPLHGGALPYIYSPITKGGLGIPCVTDEYMLYSIVTVYKSLINTDPRMQNFGIERLKRLVQMWSGLDPTPNICGDYLSHRTPVDLDPMYITKYTYMGNISRYRNAVTNLGKLGLKIDAQFSDTFEISLKVTTLDQKLLNFDKNYKGKIFSCLRNIITENYFVQLTENYPNQGRMMKDVAESKYTNQYVRDGRYINSSSFRFVHRARLNLLPIGGTPMGRHLKIAEKCRRCWKEIETLSHILGQCPSNEGLVTQRHNEVLEQIWESCQKIKRDKNVQILKEPLLKTDYGNFQPDLIKIDEQKKTVVIFDLIISSHIAKAFEIKREKYANLAIFYSNKGYTANVMPIVIGQLGTWTIASEPSLEELGFTSQRQTTVIRKMIFTTLNHSKNIYATHLFLPNIHNLKVIKK